MQNPNPVAATFRDKHKNCVRSCCCILGLLRCEQAKAGGQREALGAVGTQGVAGKPGAAGHERGGQLLKPSGGLSCHSLGPYLIGHGCELSCVPQIHVSKP